MPKHVLYGGDVAPEEAVEKVDVLKLDVYRVKSPDGTYKILATDVPPKGFNVAKK